MARLIGLLVLVLPLAVAPAAPVPTHLMPKPVPMTFPTEVGTRWVYQKKELILTKTVTAVEVKGQATIVRIGQVLGDGEADPETIEIRPSGWFWTHIGDAAIKPPLPFLKLPCRLGDVWEIPQDEARMTLREREQLTVPAGTFEALRVKCEYTGPGGDRCWSHHWYVDGVGEVKLACWDGSEQVLKSFTRGKQPKK
jgi:hypothetical protein